MQRLLREAVAVGCRTAVIYCSRPPAARDNNVVAPSCYWELQAGVGREGRLPNAVAVNVNAALELGVNIMAYATGRKVKAKLDQLADESGGPNVASDRAILDIRQAIYDGTWNAAAGFRDTGPTNVSLLHDRVIESASQIKDYLTGIGTEYDEQPDTGIPLSAFRRLFTGGNTGKLLVRVG